MEKAYAKRLWVVLAFVIVLGLSGCGEKAPAAPTGLTAAITEDLWVSLNWEPADGAAFYRVYRLEGTHVDYRFLCDVTDPSYTDKTAKSGAAYGYKITAFYGGAESEGCCSEKLTINPAGSEETAVPQIPVITSVTNLDRYTSVLMFNPNNTGCTYRIQRAEAQEGPYTLIGETEDSVYYDKTLSNGEEYFYSVTAVNDSVSSDASLPKKTGTNSLSVFGVPVLMYHQFLTPEDVQAGVSFGEYAIWASDFEQDLLWLQKNGFTTITTRELIAFMNGEQIPPEKPIILTIDDGYRGVYLNAWPLLQKHNMKAVFSVIGDRIDGATLENEDAPHAERLYCNWSELSEMEQSGHMEIISHTATCHNDEDMTNIRRGANCAEGESEESFYLAAIPDYANIAKNFHRYLGHAPYAMSYPYSSRSITSDNVWMRCGYQILYAGNSEDARKLAGNFTAVGAGVTRDSAVLRRVARMHGTAIWEYMRDYY